MNGSLSGRGYGPFAQAETECGCTPEESCGIVAAPGEACGQRCVVCGAPALVRAACGAYRCRHVHPRGALLRRHVRQPVEPVGAPGGEDRPLRLLALLEGDLIPTRKVGHALRQARLCPSLPGMTSLAHVVTGYAWQRPYKGEVVRLDRNAAFLSSAAAVLVAHEPLEHTGPLNAFDPQRAGYYLVSAHPWQEHRRMPGPLGNRCGKPVWVPAPTLQLLHQLAEAGRWADAEILDSYTAPGVRLTAWTNHLRDLRTSIITTHGVQSKQYEQFKIAFGQAITLMIGVDTPGSGRKWKCKTHRPDWAHAIQSLCAATLWRCADACWSVCEEGPVALVNIDELHVPAAAMPTITDVTRKRIVIKLDNSGIRLGTFKVKS